MFRRVLLVIGFVSGSALAIYSSVDSFPYNHLVGSIAELLVASCIMATTTSFGVDLWSYRLRICLPAKSERDAN
jgi:hypothetical protein